MLPTLRPHQQTPPALESLCQRIVAETGSLLVNYCKNLKPGDIIPVVGIWPYGFLRQPLVVVDRIKRGEYVPFAEKFGITDNDAKYYYRVTVE